MKDVRVRTLVLLQGVSRLEPRRVFIIAGIFRRVKGFGKLGASQNGGEFQATSGELHWNQKPVSLDHPKSRMHPENSERVKQLVRHLLWIRRVDGQVLGILVQGLGMRSSLAHE